MPDGLRITAEISAGELIDRITILELKQGRLSDPRQLANVKHELQSLQQIHSRQVSPDTTAAAGRLKQLTGELAEVNTVLWDIEDALRECERRSDFGPDFVQLARSVYFENDRRAALKREINRLLNSAIVEEKSYADYGSGPGGE
ncbi:MAG: hypothetical protein KDA79_14280 [Planctomycetaceae bacterium]|nr:hypothetical protein [Planctomycetaceae bacterium]